MSGDAGRDPDGSESQARASMPRFEGTTWLIPTERGLPAGRRWPVADPDVLRPYDELGSAFPPRDPGGEAAADADEAPPAGTGPAATTPAATTPAGTTPAAPTPAGTTPARTRSAPAQPAAAEPSLARTSGRIAVASLISRITGFLWKVMLIWAIGIGIRNDSFTVANTIPNIVFELLLGGVLTSVVVPLLVRSHDDADGGEAYAQRLLTVGGSVLVVGTLLTVIAAPAITALYVDDSSSRASPELTTAFAYLLLPQILFYGLFALMSAILNARSVFGPPAWAPVMNNVIVIMTIVLFTLVPGQISLDPARLSDPKLLVLGVGVTLGIVAQAAMLIAPLHRSGFRFRWRWGIDPRMKEFGGLAAWIIGYVAVSHVGFTINTRVLTAGSGGGVTAYANAWSLFQLPYGIIGVSLLTAIMPRMSRAAADGDRPRLIADLSYASRISTVTLVPISAVLTVVGSSIGVALFSLGKGTTDGAGRLGDVLAVSAFGLLPYALVMLQLRVFYAMKDARTPTLIMIVMTAVKVPLLYLCQTLLDADNIVMGAMMVNSLTYVLGAILGQVWLWARLGHIRSRQVLRVVTLTVVASGLGVGAALLVGPIVPGSLGVTLQAWGKLLVQGVVGVGVSYGVLALLKVDELDPLASRLTRSTK